MTTGWELILMCPQLGPNALEFANNDLFFVVVD